MKQAALFLFAHPDDEFGVFHCIEHEMRLGRRVRCAYLTDGGAGNATPRRRIAESIAVLRRFGVPISDIAFPGLELGIPDSGLPEHLDKISLRIEADLEKFGEPAAVYLPAWEGGHHDHDGLHAAALAVFERRNMLERTRQFPLYHSYGCKAPWFRVMTPLAANGVAERMRIAWCDRLRYVFCCFGYPSQWRSWIGLLPFVAWRYLVCGTQYLQPVSTARIRMRPHDGPLYYEQREFYTWDRMTDRVARHAAAPPGG